MPLAQLILNFVPLLLGYLVKYLFFIKNGWGDDYKEGIKEGLATMKKQKKVKFRIRHLSNYIQIEIELIIHTFAYAKDWFTRKLLKR